MTAEPAPNSPGVSRATAALKRLRESGLLDRHLGRAEESLAEAVAATGPKDRATAEPMLLTFRTGDRTWAAPSSALLEVVHEPDVVPLPGAPENLCGLMVFRGDVLPVFDLVRTLADRDGDVRGPRAGCAIVFAGRGDRPPLAIAADRAEDVIRASDGVIEPEPAGESIADADPLVVGRTAAGVELIDAAKLLSDSRLTIGDAEDGGGGALDE